MKKAHQSDSESKTKAGRIFMLALAAFVLVSW